MTNVESYLQTAVENIDSLNEPEKRFIEQIKDYNKKQLKNLSSKQFDWLRTIARKF